MGDLSVLCTVHSFLIVLAECIVNKNFGFCWGALPPSPPEFWLGGQSPSRHPLKRSFVTFDRGGQTGPPRSNDFFFGAADDTGAADDHLAGRTSVQAPAVTLGQTSGRTPAEKFNLRYTPIRGTRTGPGDPGLV